MKFKIHCIMSNTAHKMVTYCYFLHTLIHEIINSSARWIQNIKSYAPQNNWQILSSDNLMSIAVKGKGAPALYLDLNRLWGSCRVMRKCYQWRDKVIADKQSNSLQICSKPVIWIQYFPKFVWLGLCPRPR